MGKNKVRLENYFNNLHERCGCLDQNDSNKSGNKLLKSGYVLMVTSTTFPSMLDVKCEREEASWRQENINFHSERPNFLKIQCLL